MGEDGSLGGAAADMLAHRRRQHDRLAGAGRGDAEDVAVLAERTKAALDEELLAGAEHHAGAALPQRAQAGRGSAPGAGCCAEAGKAPWCMAGAAGGAVCAGGA